MDSPKIYQQLSGRLGNQLFQWAYGHQVNARYNSLIVPFHDKSHSVPGYLDNLEKLVQPCEHFGVVKNINLLGVLLKILDKLRFYNTNASIRLEQFLGIFRTTHHFQIPVNLGQKPRLVSGFYVNWKSVCGVEELLFTELNEGFKKVRTPQDLPGQYQVIHVRRGDFLGLKETYGILHPDYYLKNIQLGIDTFICTDDQELAIDIQSVIPVRKVFGPDDLTPIEAMKFMANANVLIMSNSTLSWWAGFYSSRNGGKVIISEPFYKNEESSSLHHPDFITAPAIFY